MNIWLKVAAGAGSGFIAAVLMDFKSWSEAPCDQGQRWPDWDWAAFTKHAVHGTVAGLMASLGISASEAG